MSVIKYKDPSTGEWRPVGGGFSGGGSGIDVTASVGQTIVVEEVDANGKPTKWKAVDYPLEAEELIPQTTYAAQYTSSFGVYGYVFEFSKNIIAGQKYTVIFDGTKYNLTAKPATFNGISVVYIGNDILAGDDTGEPFCLGVFEGITPNGMISLIGFDGNEHTIRMYTEKLSLAKMLTTTVEVLPETTAEFSEEDGMFLLPFAQFVGGTKCKITYNGVEYISDIMDTTEYGGFEILFGNIPVIMETGDNGIPFIGVMDTADEIGLLMPLDGSETVTLSIKQEEINKIPPKYIEDMYHIEEGLIEILPKITLETNNGNFIMENTIELMVGKTYIVNWNGISYRSQAVDLEGAYILLTDSNNVIFAIGATDEYIVFSSVQNESSISVSIAEVCEKIHKIPEKYLPFGSSIFETAEVDQTIVVKTVDESGKPTEWENRPYPVESKTIYLDTEVALETETVEDVFSFRIEYDDFYINELVRVVVVINNEVFDVVGEIRPSTDQAGYFKVKIIDIISTGLNDSIRSIGFWNSESGDSVGSLWQINFEYIYNSSADVKITKVRPETCASAIIMASSTRGSSKKFKITIDDSGSLTTTEII